MTFNQKVSRIAPSIKASRSKSMSNSDTEYGFTIDHALDNKLDQSNLEKLAQQKLEKAKSRLLQKKDYSIELDKLTNAYREERQKNDLRLFRTGQTGLLRYFNHALANPELTSGEEAKLLIRRQVLEDLVDNRDRYISDFRFEADCKKLRRVKYSMFAYNLLGQAASLVRPIDDYDEFDIHNKAQVETFYGHLLSALSGHDQLAYELYRSRKTNLEKLVETEIPKPFSALSSLGITQPAFNIALLQRDMQEQIRAAYGQSSDAPIVAELTFHYPSYSMQPDIQQDLVQFGNLPIGKNIWYKIVGLLGKYTKESFLKYNQKEHPSFPYADLMVDIFIQIIKLLQQAKKPALATEVASSISSDLIDIIKDLDERRPPYQALQQLKALTHHLAMKLSSSV